MATRSNVRSVVADAQDKGREAVVPRLVGGAIQASRTVGWRKLVSRR
jgi:hypothetical protein